MYVMNACSIESTSKIKHAQVFQWDVLERNFDIHFEDKVSFGL